MSEWAGLADWWLSELRADPEYDRTVLPLALDLLQPSPGERILDVGCGEGRVMRAVDDSGAEAVGCDLEVELLRDAARAGGVVRCGLPDLGWAKPGSFDAVVVVLVLEHLADDRIFEEARRVAVEGGRLIVVVNHPIITSPGSAPVVDPRDDEILWRFGDYFGDGHTEEPAGEATIRFHHRSMERLLGAAASAGWALERLVERGADPATADPLLARQSSIPRLAGLLWRAG